MKYTIEIPYTILTESRLISDSRVVVRGTDDIQFTIEASDMTEVSLKLKAAFEILLEMSDQKS